MAGNSKNVIVPTPVVTNGDMSAAVTSKVTTILYLDRVVYQLNFTGTPTGTFAVQVSSDYQSPPPGGTTPINAGNWVTLPIQNSSGVVPSASGAADQIVIEIGPLTLPFIRVVYTPTSGSGTLNAIITAKAD